MTEAADLSWTRSFEEAAPPTPAEPAGGPKVNPPAPPVADWIGLNVPVVEPVAASSQPLPDPRRSRASRIFGGSAAARSCARHGRRRDGPRRHAGGARLRPLDLDGVRGLFQQKTELQVIAAIAREFIQETGNMAPQRPMLGLDAGGHGLCAQRTLGRRSDESGGYAASFTTWIVCVARQSRRPSCESFHRAHRNGPASAAGSPDREALASGASRGRRRILDRENAAGVRVRR